MRKMIIISYGLITLTEQTDFFILEKTLSKSEIPDPDFLYNCL